MNQTSSGSSNNKGLTFRIPPELASRLRRREGEIEAEAVATATVTVSPENDFIERWGKEQNLLPVVSLDLERLIGYKPSPEEHDSIRSQLLNAMWMRYRDEQQQQQKMNDDDNPNEKEEFSEAESLGIPPPDFDAQVVELLRSGVATFGRRRKRLQREQEVEDEQGHQQKEEAQLLIISYPPMLHSFSLPSSNSDNITRRCQQVRTIELWNDILNYPTISTSTTTPDNEDHRNDKTEGGELNFLDDLWQYLIDCSQSLVWKYDMSIELRNLVQTESAKLEYDEWIHTKRQTKLDHLYNVRETIVHQLEVEETKLQLKEEERENQVRNIMQHYYRTTSVFGDQQQGDARIFSLESFGTSELSFPDEFQLLGISDGLDSNNDNRYDDNDENYGRRRDLDAPEDDGDDDYDDEDLLSFGSEDNEHSSAEESGRDQKSKDAGIERTDDVIPPSLPDTLQGDIIHDTTETTTTSESNLVDYCIRNHDDHQQAMPSSSAGDSINSDNASCAKQEGAEKDVTKVTEESSKNATTTAPMTTVPFLKRKERRKKALKRKKLQRQKELEEERRKLKAEQAKSIEDETRSKLTTQDMVLSQAMCTALRRKVEKVEELLESLQDEVWEAEEQEQGEIKQADVHCASNSALSFSLLDQVLAMILGSMPIPPNMMPSEHFKLMKMEHKSIVQGWQNHFGRLPPPAIGTIVNSMTTAIPEEDAGRGIGEEFEVPEAPTALSSSREVLADGASSALLSVTADSRSDLSTSEQRRAALGIKENDGEDWEVVEDWEELIAPMMIPTAATEMRGPDFVQHKTTLSSAKGQKETTEGAPRPPVKSKLVGLRPGGSTRR